MEYTKLDSELEEVSHTKSGLPTDGSPVWVRLWYREGGVWKVAGDFPYTAATP